jgi:hypothetical protein
MSIKDHIKRALLSRNILVSRPTETALLETFFSSLKPVATNHDLLRIGGKNDGGYLVPDDLEGIGACFSPGVSNVADFELDLANRGIKCYLADNSVDAPPIDHLMFDFEKKHLGPVESPQFMTLENWVARKAARETDLILQMDIEGAEYGVLLDTSTETLKRFRILVIEFHGLDFVRDRWGHYLADLTFKKLLKNFEVVHIHPNNHMKPVVYKQYEMPPFIEFTFLRKDRISQRRRTYEFPHNLDRRNVPHKEDYPLPRCWFA